eukprot:6177961-Pleurochrysis_carterae.AAC.4
MIRLCGRGEREGAAHQQTQQPPPHKLPTNDGDDARPWARPAGLLVPGQRVPHTRASRTP